MSFRPISLTFLLLLPLAGVAFAAITTQTNDRLFADSVAAGRAFRDLDGQCRAVKERFYLLGIAQDPENGGQAAVTGFQDANGLPKGVVPKAASLCIEFLDWLSSNSGARFAAYQAILINEPAQ